MLSSFAVKNFRGFKDWFTFDLASSNNYEFNTECVSEGLVKTALIYGYNGVGKSNLGLAIFDIISHITDKMFDRSLFQNYQNASTNLELAEFRYLFSLPNGRAEYSYGKKDIDTIIYENLVINDTSVISYDRRKDDVFQCSLDGTTALAKDITSLKISAVKYVRSNSVLPSCKDNDTFYDMISFIERMLMFWSLENRKYLGYESGPSDMLQDIVSKNHVEEFKKFLQNAGLRDNIKVIEVESKNKFVYDFDGNSIDFFRYTSAGIRSLTLFYYWYQRMETVDAKPSFVFIDEYDAFYHSQMAELVISVLKKLDIQVILTTHNTTLLSNELMRPDCCFLMYENKILPLSKRTDRELRLAHNIEKMYKAGVFNAL